MENFQVFLRDTNMSFSGDRVAGSGAQINTCFRRTRARADCNASLGSAEVGAALSNVLLLRSGLGLERERGYIAEARARALEPVEIEHLWEFRSRHVVSGLRIDFRELSKHPFRG